MSCKFLIRAQRLTLAQAKSIPVILPHFPAIHNSMNNGEIRSGHEFPLPTNNFRNDLPRHDALHGA